MDGHIMTFHSIVQYEKDLFRKVGWVVIAASQGDPIKPLQFINECRSFHKSIKLTQRATQSADNQRDLDTISKHVWDLARAILKLSNVGQPETESESELDVVE
jgi:hypothetical protein